MKILVINSQLEKKHIELIKTTAEKLGAEVHFYKAESEIPQSDFDTDIIYGFAPSIVKTSKTLKWLCVPWAGVDSIMKPGYFANEDCLLTNAAGAYGVSIAEHMIAVSPAHPLQGVDSLLVRMLHRLSHQIPTVLPRT